MTKQTVVTCDWCERPVTGEVATMFVRTRKGETVKIADLCLECVDSLPGAEPPARRSRRKPGQKSKRETPTGRQIAYAESLAHDAGDEFEVKVTINGNPMDFDKISAYISRLASPEQT
jgi:hypothetical protein